MNTTVYEETLTGRPHDTSIQKATSDKENVDSVNVMPRTPVGRRRRYRQDVVFGWDGIDLVESAWLVLRRLGWARLY